MSDWDAFVRMAERFAARAREQRIDAVWAEAERMVARRREAIGMQGTNWLRRTTTRKGKVRQ